jgi:sortase A
MTETVATAPAAEPPPPRSRMTFGDKVRFVLRGIGQTLITLGLVVLLFVVYEVWITNIFADRNNSHNIQVVQHEWTQGVDPLLPLPGSKGDAIPVGTAIGILYLPRLGTDYHEAIVEGGNPPDDSQLQQGVAHYGDTQLPGQIGNFAVAGHRVGKGEPFLNIDQLQAGDAVIVETKSWWYVYRVKGHPGGSDPQT